MTTYCARRLPNNKGSIVLGNVTCRILSTLLGIGVAERAWGAVKHLKNGQRSHLGAAATRMQATIFSASCIKKAQTLKVEKEQSKELWNDDDLEFQLGLENFAADEAGGVAQARNPRRPFHTWGLCTMLKSAGRR